MVTRVASATSATSVRRGYWLRLARRRRGLSLADVAEQLGYVRSSQTTVKLWEDGRRDPTVAQLEALAELYRIDARFFVDPLATDEERLEEWGREEPPTANGAPSGTKGVA